jgi:hypothetical protein
MKLILLLASLALSTAAIASEQFPDNQRTQARRQEEKERDAKAREYREKTEAQIESDRQLATEFAEQDARKAQRQRIEKLQAEFGWKKAQAEQEQQEKVAGDAPGKKPVHPCSYISGVLPVDENAANAQDQKKEAEQQQSAPRKRKKKVSLIEMRKIMSEAEQCYNKFMDAHEHQVRIWGEREAEFSRRMCIVVSHYKLGVDFSINDFGAALHGVIETAYAEGDIPDNVMHRYRRAMQDPIANHIRNQVLEEFGYDSPDDANQHASLWTLLSMKARMGIILMSHVEYAIEFLMMKDEIVRYLFERLPQRVQAQDLSS